MRSGALAAPGGTTWIPIEKETRREPWWSPTSPVIAGALVMALIIALSASFISSRRSTPPPTDAPGFAAASPGATEPLSCGAPGYRAVIVGDPDTTDLAAVDSGGPPIMIGDDTVTTTLADGEALSVPSGTSSWVRGNALITVHEDESKTITRLADGDQWDLPASDAPVDGNPRYFITPTDDSRTNLSILDIETGDETTTADILGAQFALPVDLQHIYMTDDSGAVFTMYVKTDPAGSADDAPTPQFSGVLVIPGSLDNAYFTMLAPDTRVSPDGELLISVNEVFDADTGHRILHDGAPVRFNGEPVGFAADPAHLLVIDDGMVHDVELTTGAASDVFAAENDVQIVGYDRAAGTMVVGTGAGTSEPPETWSWIDLATGEQTSLPELDGYALSRTSLDDNRTRPVDRIAQFNSVTNEQPWLVRGLDMATGEVTSSTLRHYVREDRAWIVLSPTQVGDGYLAAQGRDGAISVLSPIDDEVVDLGFPAEAERLTRGNSIQQVRLSPSGSCLLLTIEREGNHASFITPIQPGGAWAELPFAVSGWVERVDAGDARTLPAQDFATPMATPALGASCEMTPPNGDTPPGENADLDWFGSGAEDPSLWLMMTWDDGTITTNQAGGDYPVKLTFWRGEGSGEVDVTANGPDGTELPADTFTPFRGTVMPGIHPMGGELPESGCWTFTATDGNDTLTWTVEVQPIYVTSISVTAKDDIFVSVNSVTASGASTWDGKLAAGETAGPFEGVEFEVATSSGENTLFTNGCDHIFNMGYEPGEAYYILKADAASCPPGATPAASPEASPTAASAPGTMMVVEGPAAEARVEGGIRIATLGDDGLTLPVDGETVTLPDVAQVRAIRGHLDTLHIIRADATEAVIDLATGDVLFELPGFEDWARGSGRWQFVPTDDTLTDWTVIDMTTGEIRLLSELVDLPGDTAVMPHEIPSVDPDSSSVFEVEPGTRDGMRWSPSGPAVTTFVIAGSFDRVSPLPDYPTSLDNVGEPTLVASADGGTVAYETRAGADLMMGGETRIITLDVATGEVLERASTAEVSENPTLAGFTADGQMVALSTSSGKVMMIGARQSGTLVVRDGLGKLDNPRFYAPESTFYVREDDSLLRIEAAPGVETTEVATSLVPGAFGFTTPGGNWIVAQTRDGHIMVDARTGEVVSRMKAPANRARLADGEFGPPVFDVDDDGDTVIFAVATPLTPLGPNESPAAAWLLSPDFPNGLEVTTPENAGGYWLSPDGETLYAWTSERQSGPGDIWATSLGAEPAWELVAEDITPLSRLMVFQPEG